MHQFHFVPELDLVVHEFGEQIDDESLLADLLSVYDHPDFRLDMDILASFLNIRRSSATAEGLRHVARTVAGRFDPAVPANLVAVVTTSKLGHGLIRLFGAYADRDEKVGIGIFPTVAAAADWLDEARGRQPGTTAAAAGRLLRDPGPAPA